MTISSKLTSQSPFGEFHFYLDDAKTQASLLGHTFLWSEDYQGKEKMIKIFNSAKSIQHFIDDYYLRLPQEERICYELIGGVFYMYFDLDVEFKIKNTNEDLNETNLFYWFDSIYREFIAYSIANNTDTRTCYVNQTKEATGETKLSRASLNFLLPNWIVTTASDHTKLSIHLVNRNVVFDNLDHFKHFYNEFEAFITSFVPEDHPFKKAFDISVASKNRSMRLCGSQKLGNNRILRPFKEVHPMGLKLRDTFINDAPYDPKLQTKIFTDAVAESLWDKEERHTKSSTVRHFEPIEPQKKEHLDQINELLDMLSYKRTDDRKYWLDIAIILKQHKLPYSLFERFSKRSKKFDPVSCQDTWDSIEDRSSSELPKGKKLTIGTLHYYANEDDPEKYRSFKTRYQTFSLNIPFTPHQTINEKFIPESLYINGFSLHDIIAIKSCMMTGKTYALPKLFDGLSSIVVVYFRITLSKELLRKWKSLGFVLYSDLKGDIDLTKTPRIIIQIDSIYRLQGKTDLLVLDEIESTYTHLCAFKQIDHTKCFNTLTDYITHSPKVLLADANLSDETVNVLVKERIDRCVKISNTYKSFSHLKAEFATDKDAFNELIIQLLRMNKRIVIPTNSKSFSIRIQEIIRHLFPELKVLLINSDTDKEKKADEISTEHWKELDVLIYTPTIVAGVSFDERHFHSCCAYFINKSCNAEMSSQMLHRVRHLLDNQLYIYTPESFKVSDDKKCLPLTKEEIVKQINQRILSGHSHLAEEGLELSRFSKQVIQNDYFNLYCEFTRKKNLSTLFFKEYLQFIFTFHGISYSNYQKKVEMTQEQKQDFTEALLQSKGGSSFEKAQKVIAAKPIDHNEYIKLIEKKDEKTVEQQLSITRHYLTNTMRLDPRDTLENESEWVEDVLPKLKSINLLKPFIDKNITESIEVVKTKHKENYDRELYQQAMDYLKCKREELGNASSESDSDLETRRSKHIIRKKNVKQTAVYSIHYDRTWLRLQVAFEILQMAGFKILNETEKVKVDWPALHDYCKKNEERIRALFDVERRLWKETLSPDEKVSLNKYINHKLDKMLAVQIKDITKKGIIYRLFYQFKWLGKQVFDSENIKTDTLIVTEFDLISEDESEICHTGFLYKNNVGGKGIEREKIESSYKMPLPPIMRPEELDKLQEAEKAKMARQEYERRQEEIEYTKNWLDEQKRKTRERYLKNKEKKKSLSGAVPPSVV